MSERNIGFQPEPKLTTRDRLESLINGGDSVWLAFLNLLFIFITPEAYEQIGPCGLLPVLTLTIAVAEDISHNYSKGCRRIIEEKRSVEAMVNREMSSKGQD